MFNAAANLKGYTASLVHEWMRVEYWWKITDKVKPKYPEENISQCQFVHQKSHTDCSWGSGTKEAQLIVWTAAYSVLNCGLQGGNTVASLFFLILKLISNQNNTYPIS